MPGPNAPHAEYPKPIGVMTATLIGYDPEDPYRIVLIELRNPESAQKAHVLPGGIFDVGSGRHRSQRDVVRAEIIEETGLQFQSGSSPLHFAISQRLDVDPRRWCSFPTINGANDYLMAAALIGEIKPRDEEEVRSAYWQDVREVELQQLGRGHDLLIKLWRLICECGGLREELYIPEHIARIEALSNDRHRVEVSHLTRMIYLEDQSAVRDERQ